MSDHARRKEKHRLKRAKKKSAMRRMMSGSPYKRIGEVGAMEACYINSEWQERGLATIHVVRCNPAGGYAVGCFLVDLWCAGLKDAWGRLDFQHEELNELLDRSGSVSGGGLVRIEADPVRALIAGSIRFARRNGFRLPKHYDRWTALLGDIGDVNSASLADFGKDGGLLWVGPIEDLRRRLIGCTVEDFFTRPDVHYVAGLDEFPEYAADEEPVDDEDDFDEQDEFDDSDAFDEQEDHATVLMLEKWKQSADTIAQALRQRCLDRGEEFSETMSEAVRLMFTMGVMKEAFQSPGSDQESDPQSALSRILGSEKDLEKIIEGVGGEIPQAMGQVIKRVAKLMNEMGGELESLLKNTV